MHCYVSAAGANEETSGVLGRGYETYENTLKDILTRTASRIFLNCIYSGHWTPKYLKMLITQTEFNHYILLVRLSPNYCDAIFLLTSFLGNGETHTDRFICTDLQENFLVKNAQVFIVSSYLEHIL